MSENYLRLFGACLRAQRVCFFKPLLSRFNHWAGQKQFLTDQSLELNRGPHEPKWAERQLPDKPVEVTKPQSEYPTKI